MLSTNDFKLQQKYRSMLSLDQVDNIADINKVFNISQITNLNTILNQKVNITNTSLISNGTINSDLYISGNTNIMGTGTVISNLNVLNSSLCNNLIVNNNTLLNGQTTILSSLYVSGTCTLNNVNINTINGNNLFINGSTINIGTANSIINMNGTYITNSQSVYEDKLITLNYISSTNNPADIGSSSGIQILGTSGNGYIKTNLTADRFLIKAPLGDNVDSFIATFDSDNNFNVSGNSLFYGNKIINSNLLF
jgi:hypothetical protein